MIKTTYAANLVKASELEKIDAVSIQLGKGVQTMNKGIEENVKAFAIMYNVYWLLV